MLDRELQREILVGLRKLYPERSGFRYDDDEERKRYLVNVAYLVDHGLIDCHIQFYHGDSPPNLGPMVITAKGIDFVEDDGGLSAIMNVVTVRLHADTVKELLVERVSQSSEPEGTKASIIRAIRQLPAEATRSLSMKLLEKGIQQSPNLAAWLQTTLGS